MIPMIKQLDNLMKKLDQNTIAEAGAEYLNSITPRRTGNARNQTYADKNLIRADYPYATRLDENYSKQTHNKGLIQPTLEFLDEYVGKIG